LDWFVQLRIESFSQHPAKFTTPEKNSEKMKTIDPHLGTY